MRGHVGKGLEARGGETGWDLERLSGHQVERGGGGGSRESGVQWS